MQLVNKNILITGGTSGIGLEMVRQLAADNQVIVISRRGELPPELAESDNGSHNCAVALFHADLANKTEVESVIDQIQRHFRSIDVLINNAAMQFTPEFLSDDFNFDSIQREIDVNFTSVCHLTYLCLPLLQMTEHSVVLNVNSGLAIAPKQGSAIYCATKAALDSLSKSLSYQLQNTPIDVQQVFLPLVDTAMTKGRGTGKLTPAFVASRIIRGIQRSKSVNDVGKVNLLRLINYLMPPLAQRIMKAG